MTGVEREGRVRAAIEQFVDRAFPALDQTDYYRMLGVSSAATEGEIRAAYYKLAARLHPDVHGEGCDPDFRQRLTTVFSRVVEAYKVLSDPRRRQEYDSGLAQGRMRLRSGVTLKIRVEEAISDGNARKFFLLAQEALESGDARSAVMNLRIALGSEPDSEVLKTALARAQERLDSGSGRGGGGQEGAT